MRTGAPWADICLRYGPHTPCVNRFNRWRKAGHWARLLDAVSKAYDGDIQMIDNPSIRVHQHGGNAKKDGRSSCMGRSRGALTTRIHGDGRCQWPSGHAPLGAGQAYDGHSAFDMLDSLKPGSILLADRAYDADKLRAAIAAKGAWANIPAMPQRRHKPAFSPFLYKYRNLVERFFSKLKNARRLATRLNAYLIAI